MLAASEELRHALADHDLRSHDLRMAEMHRASGRDRLADIREMTPEERVVALIHASSLMSDEEWAAGLDYVEATRR